jgi:PIN domain nuclease of toxin-antitoxin system
MNLLLDTHVLLWAIDQPARLSRKAIKVLSDEDNELVVSVASLWEILLKKQAGKLRLPATPEYFQAHLQTLGVSRLMAIQAAHIYRLLQLPVRHKDPFDRLLVAQCQVEKLTLLTRDPEIRKYPVDVIW